MRLQLTGLTKCFGANRVLDAISLDLPDIHALVLIGPSGGGKSTLPPHSRRPHHTGLRRGRHRWHADPARCRCAPRLPRPHRHRLPGLQLFPHLSALDNIVLPLRVVHHLPPAEARERAMETLSRFQLAPHAHKQPAQLSGGQQQRVAIARAVAISPQPPAL